MNTVKKRRVSKKTKKSWRKNVNIKDVEAFLEDKRLEERLGVPFSECLDSELFTIDTTRNKDLLDSREECKVEKSNKAEKNSLNKKVERRARLRLKEPRCFAALKPHTKVPDPISKRNRVKTPEERKNPITRRIEKERKAAGILKLKEKIALKNRALAVEKRMKKRKCGTFTEDIWETNLNTAPDLDNEWYTSDTVRHILTNTGRKRKIVPQTLGKKASVLPAVEIPHPGTSYNPSFSDHQDLLKEVAKKQLEFEKEEAHLNRVTSKMFSKVTREDKENNILNEMSEGLSLKSENGVEDSNPDLEDQKSAVKSVNPPAKYKKKTLKERRKQKEQRQLQLQLRDRKMEKKKLADIHKLKLLEKELAKRERKEKLLREKKEKIKQKKAMEPKILGRAKFEAPEPDFQLGTELTGNLRNSAPIGNLLKDRYKSLQQRNIVAPGTLVLKRSRGKVKKFIKPDHRIDLNYLSKK